MTFIGDLERAFASFIFPNLLPLSILFVIGVIGLAVLARRRGWDRIAQRHPRGTVIAVAALLIVGIPVGTYLSAPLFIRTELVEAAPGPATAGADATPSPTAAAAQPSVGIAAPSVAAPSVVAPSSTARPSVAVPARPSVTSPPSPTAPPAPTPSPSPTAVFPITQAKGTFVGADDFHFGRGRALIIETAPGKFVVRFEDFSVRNGPDLHVFLSPDPDGYAKGVVDLGKLKATDGAFNYQVPAMIDIGSVRSVVVWCVPFGVQFAHAELSTD